jgi:hypothetical protein
MDRRSARLWLLAALFAAAMVYLEVSTRPRPPTSPEASLPSDAFIEIE